MSSQVQLLKKYGIEVRGNSGQHLLVDENIQKKIVSLAEPLENQIVLEIGPGLGALTGELLKRGAMVVAVEKDPRFCDILEKEFAGFGDRFKVIQNDILKTELRRILKPGKKQKHFKAVSNLPYYVTAPVLLYLMDHRDLLSSAVLTMQKEVAARLVALPGSKDYGRLTLAIRSRADVRIAFSVSPSCFTPKPEVDSSVVVLKMLSPENTFDGIDEDLFFYLIQAAFQQRRKTLRRVLTQDKRLGAKNWDVIFKKLGFPERVRGEELMLKDYLALSREVAAS